MAKEYWKEHETSHSESTCKPHWCGDCGYLIKYVVEIDFDKVDYDKWNSNQAIVGNHQSPR